MKNLKQVRLYYENSDSYFYGFLLNNIFFFADNGKPLDLKCDPPDEIKELDSWANLYITLAKNFHKKA